jgi:TonB family protein
MKRHLIATLIFLTALTALAASQEKTTRLQVDIKQMSDQLITKVAPAYPPLARQARIQGTVVLKATINKTGDVVNLQLISGHPMLAPAAIEAVKRWKYKPYVLNGEPVEVETNVTVNFQLAEPPKQTPSPDEPPTEGAVPGGIPGGQGFGVIGSVSSTPGDANHPGVPVRVRVSKGVSQGLLITKVAPEYPADAREARIQGVVILGVIINKEGNVESIQLISGHPMLAPAAIEAVKQWKYKPYLLNGNPVEVDTQIQVNFTLAP